MKYAEKLRTQDDIGEVKIHERRGPGGTRRSVGIMTDRVDAEHRGAVRFRLVTNRPGSDEDVLIDMDDKNALRVVRRLLLETEFGLDETVRLTEFLLKLTPPSPDAPIGKTRLAPELVRSFVHLLLRTTSLSDEQRLDLIQSISSKAKK